MLENGKNKTIEWKGIQGITVLLLFVSAVVLFITHRAVPFMMDDLWYSTMLSSDRPIASLRDIIESQIWHYQNWGGRSVTHGLLQLTLLWGETAADILNVLMTALLAGMICVTSGNRRITAFFAGFGLVLGLNANWKMSMFWQAGAANYLYITVFILLFLNCYLREAEDTPQKQLPGVLVWILPLGLAAGWSNENMGPAAWVISFLVILLKWKEKQKVKLWMILGNISCLAGSVLVVTAPGNFVRSAEAAQNGYGPLWNFFLRCYAEAQAALQFLFPVLLVLAGMLIIGNGVLKLPVGRKNWLLLLCALLSWGAMVLSPHYPDRATFGTMVMISCVILSLASRITQVCKDLGIWLWGASVLIWLRGMFYLCEYLAISWGWIR